MTPEQMQEVTDMGHRIMARGLLAIVAAAGLFYLAPPAPVQGQAGSSSIVGRVVDRRTGQPIEGAAVALAGTEHEATTSESGIFALDDLPPGRFEVGVRYLGMESRSFPVRLAPRQPLTVEFRVQMEVVPVASLNVTVEQSPPQGKLHEFYRRASEGPGYFITRAEIEDQPAGRTTDLLRRVPGLDVGPPGRVERIPVTMGRREGCVPYFWVDGTRAPYFDVDDLEPVDIAGIEVYRGNSEVPIRFKHGDRCGVIVIWTRDPSRLEGFD